MAYTVTNNPWKSQYPINTGTETVTAQLNVSGVPDGNRYTAYFDDGVNNNMVIQHASGTIFLRGNGASSMLLGTDGVERIRIAHTTGNLGIGTSSPSYKLEVSGTFYSSGSSMDYKQEVQDYKPNADAIMNLRPVNYEYTDEYKHFGKRLENNSPQIGLVAEEVAKVMPELAVMKEEGGKDVVRNVDYEKLTVVLLSELQNMKKEIEKLKNKI